ncbi:MAG: hypothetical protein Kow0075_17460 [Salibacteraceae bacterium]
MRALIVLFLCFVLTGATAQDSAFVRQMIDSLCSPRYHGRGYVKNGDVKAANFIVRQLKEMGVNEVEMHPFELGVNTFPGRADISISGKQLTPGVDYLIAPESRACDGSYKVVQLKSKWAKSPESLFKQVNKGRFNNAFVAIDLTKASPGELELLGSLRNNPLKAEGYILVVKDKLTWRVGRSVWNTTVIELRHDAAPKNMSEIEVALDQEFLDSYRGVNVVATLGSHEGATKPKILFTAHLDHLGRMGMNTMMPGANDNASGSAMLLDLVKFYQHRAANYEMVFVWFGGEEAGLVGSTQFVENPPFELDDILMVINLDLMGDAKGGITVVNGKIFSEEFARLSSLNAEMGLLPRIKARGEAANSDHHPFYEKGVKSIFIYTMGDYKHYHDVLDRPENLPLTNYNQLFELITAFVESGL